MTAPDPSAIAGEPPALSPRGPEVAPLTAPRVLLVDDDPGFVETFAALLARAGYAVTTASTYSAAKHHLGSCQADVLITDIRLDSEVNGWQLAKLATQQHPAVPVIVVTGWSDAREAEIEYFRVPVFLKPFDPDDVLDYLQSTMRLSAAQASAAYSG